MVYIRQSIHASSFICYNSLIFYLPLYYSANPLNDDCFKNTGDK